MAPKKAKLFIDSYRQQPLLPVHCRQIHIAPVFCHTAHSNQGATLPAATADLQRSRGVSDIASYVAISRGRSREDLLSSSAFERNHARKDLLDAHLLLLNLRGQHETRCSGFGDRPRNRQRAKWHTHPQSCIALLAPIHEPEMGTAVGDS